MGSALVRGLIARGLAPQDIAVGEADEARRIALAAELGVRVTADNREAIRGADVVVLAVKPQDMAGTGESLPYVLLQLKTFVLSIAPGIPIAPNAAWWGGGGGGGRGVGHPPPPPFPGAAPPHPPPGA